MLSSGHFFSPPGLCPSRPSSTLIRFSPFGSSLSYQSAAGCVFTEDPVSPRVTESHLSFHQRGSSPEKYAGLLQIPMRPTSLMKLGPSLRLASPLQGAIQGMCHTNKSAYSPLAPQSSLHLHIPATNHSLWPWVCHRLCGDWVSNSFFSMEELMPIFGIWFNLPSLHIIW